MARVVIKPGVTFTKIAPGGFEILNALRAIAHHAEFDLTITDFDTQGVHMDGSRHYVGEAVDVRSKSMTMQQKEWFRQALDMALGSRRFYFAIEKPSTPSEHWHIQVKKGTRYTIEDLLTWGA